MNKAAIIQALRKNHTDFVTAVQSLSAQDFMAAPAHKWTAGQHLAHIYKSVRPLAMGLLLPKFAVRLMFGKANRPSKSYDDLVLKYQIILQNGGKAGAAFIPKAVSFEQKTALGNRVLAIVERLIKNIQSYSEEELDAYILPHPLLGKLTLREMLYFTAYHVTHHHKSITP